MSRTCPPPGGPRVVLVRPSRPATRGVDFSPGFWHAKSTLRRGQKQKARTCRLCRHRAAAAGAQGPYFARTAVHNQTARSGSHGTPTAEACLRGQICTFIRTCENRDEPSRSFSVSSLWKSRHPRGLRASARTGSCPRSSTRRNSRNRRLGLARVGLGSSKLLAQMG